eukprot:GABV01001053.1.p1 GENE.GABV01001053.1~~GABV01001053.1.p1  ORF type:complete len:291 (+),score=101.50 GABV01001053.1:97-969(+)
MRSVYEECIQQLILARTKKETSRWGSGASSSSSAAPAPSASRAKRARGIEETLLTVFFRAVSFEFQAGYTERAFAAFQALIELNVFRPPALHNAPPTQTGIWFRVFWESDTPRIGEPNAPTWATWFDQIHQRHNTPVPPPWDTFPPAPPPPASADPLERWLFQENSRQINHNLPLRDLLSPDAADLHTIVLYDDISIYLFDIHDPDLLRELLFQFLSFIGVPSTLLGGERRESSASPFALDRAQELEFFESVPGLAGPDSVRSIFLSAATIGRRCSNSRNFVGVSRAQHF